MPDLGTVHVGKVVFQIERIALGGGVLTIFADADINRAIPHNVYPCQVYGPDGQLVIDTAIQFRCPGWVCAHLNLPIRLHWDGMLIEPSGEELITMVEVSSKPRRRRRYR